MMTEDELKAEIRYAEGYLDGLLKATGKTKAETTVIRERAHQTKRRELSRLAGSFGLTGGFATFLFGSTIHPANDIWAGLILMAIGFILVVVSFSSAAN